jgi:hypothetical protein
MSLSAGRFARGLGRFLACAILLPVAALAQEEARPRYTYLGALFESSDAKCAIEEPTEGVDGYTVEGSLGFLDFLHLTGAYFDGETDGTNLDATCYEIGAGVSYEAAPGTDIVLRGYWVNAELDDDDEDGFEPELLVRHMLSEKAEVHAGMRYYDVGDVDNTEIRLGVVYSLKPWLALQAGGSVFDDDSSFFAGLRFYLGDNVF